MRIPCLQPAGGEPAPAAFLPARALMRAAALPAMAEESCVEVEIGGEKAPSLPCLNRTLRKQADTAVHGGTAAPLDATSPSAALGGYNESALKQQYGPNFGISAEPWHPTPSHRTTPR